MGVAQDPKLLLSVAHVRRRAEVDVVWLLAVATARLARVAALVACHLVLDGHEEHLARRGAELIAIFGVPAVH